MVIKSPSGSRYSSPIGWFSGMANLSLIAAESFDQTGAGWLGRRTFLVACLYLILMNKGVCWEDMVEEMYFASGWRRLATAEGRGD